MFYSHVDAFGDMAVNAVIIAVNYMNSSDFSNSWHSVERSAVDLKKIILEKNDGI